MTTDDRDTWWREPFDPTDAYSLEDVFESWCRVALARRALSRDLRVHRVSRRGSYPPGRDELLARVERLGGRLVAGGAPDERAEGLGRVYVFEDGLVIVEHSRTGEAHFVAITTRESLAEAAHEVCSGFDEEARGVVHVVTRGAGCVTLRVATHGGLPLERSNYAPDVLEGFDRAVADLSDRSPAGRIALVEGPPGTGKTHLVRGLLHAVSPATFVLMPAEMIESLDRPDMMPLMLDVAEQREGKGPLVLLVEDADGCLVPRSSDNMSAIRSLLNCSDGILGSAFDVRIVATTNARRFEIEPALLRPGRLSERITVGRLPRDQAAAVLRRLTGVDAGDWPAEDVTQAEVYAEARRRRTGARPDVPRGTASNRRAGFVS